MKKFWFLAMVAMMITASCSKDEEVIPPDPPIIPSDTGSMSLVINTDLETGMSVERMEICLLPGGLDPINEIKIQISPGVDTLFFTGQQAQRLLNKAITAYLVIAAPEFNGNPCNLIYLSEEQLTFTGANKNFLSWEIGYAEVTVDSVMFSINIICPEGVGFSYIVVALGEISGAVQVGGGVSPGNNTLFFSDLVPYIGAEGVANMQFQAFKDGEAISLNQSPTGPIYFTIAPTNTLTWTLTYP